MKRVSLVIITDGRLEYLEKTVESAEENLKYLFLERLLINDAPDAHYDLQKKFPQFKLISHPKKKGLAGAVQTAWTSLRPDTEYIFHLEEDFTFNQPVDIGQMINLLEKHPYLSQVVLRRQPWSEEEKAVGGYQYLYDLDYVEVEEDGVQWMENRMFFSLNPCLYPKRIADLGWPETNERGFTEFLNEDPAHRSAVLGNKKEPPRVHHIGYSRSSDWKE